MDPEKLKTIEEALLEGEENIVEVKSLFTMYPVKEAVEEQIILGNYYHLVKTSGRLGKDEYCALFEKCVKQNNFYDLAVLFHESEVARRQQYLRDHPDLPEQGKPGKAQMRSAIAVAEGAREGLETVQKRDGRVPLHLIGYPALREQPDWLIAISQSGMWMKEVYDFLEKKGLPQTPTHDRQVEEVQGGVKGGVEDLM